jgi:hypothetical protein
MKLNMFLIVCIFLNHFEFYNDFLFYKLIFHLFIYIRTYMHIVNFLMTCSIFFQFCGFESLVIFPKK